MINKIVLLLAFITAGLSAQTNTGFVLLKIDVDARAAALAGAYTSLATDASAAYWNPAGLSLAESNTINIMYNNWIWDISHSYAAVQFTHGEHNLALSFNYFQIPGIKITGNTPAEPSASSDAFNLAIALSYATEISRDWHVGANVKYLFEKYYMALAPGWALDLGVLKRDILDNLDWGMSIQNIGKMSKLDKIETPLPLLVRTGVSYKLANLFDNYFIVSTDLLWIKEEKTYFRIGTEYQLADYFVLRAGFKNGNEDLLWTAGLGICYGSFHVDYAYAPFEYDLGSANRLSLGLTF